MAHVFLSYSSRDRPAVELLHQRLESAGITVWRDQTRLDTDWSREIAEALCNSDAVVLIWTDHSARSRWVKNEWLTARASEIPILPCAFPDAPELPEPLYNLHGIVVRDAGGPEQLIGQFSERLIARLNALDGERAAYDYTVRPDRFDVPYQPIPSFVGRHSDLLDLYLRLIGNLNNTGTRAVGLVGMGGTGKTQLAVELAWRFAFAFDGTHWLDGTNPEEWRSQLVGLAKRLALPVPDPDKTTDAQWLAALRQHCIEHPSMLLVLDNVTNPSNLNDLLGGTAFSPLALGCNLLFTTRQRFEFESDVPLQEVGMLSPESARALLTLGRPPATPAEEASADAICNAVGYLPLALVLAGAYLRTFREKSFESYRELLLKYGLDAIDTRLASKQKLATRHEAAVGRTLAEQWRMVSDENARLLFKLAGQLAQAALIPRDRLRLLSGIGPGATELEMPVDEAFMALRDLSLMSFQENTRSVSLHPLVRDFSFRLVVEEDRPRLRAGAAAHLAATYDDATRFELGYLDRGAHQIIGDLAVAAEWLDEGDSTRTRIDALRQLLDRERGNLDDRRGPIRPLLFQQLQHRAVLMGQDSDVLRRDLVESCRRAGVPGLVTRSASAEDPALLRVLQGHEGPVTAVCMLPGGRRALSGSSDGTLILWDLDSGDAVNVLRGHTGGVNSLQASADGRRAVSGGTDRTLIVWDLQEGGAPRTLAEHRGEITGVAISGDGRVAISASADEHLAVWDLETGECTRTYKSRSSTIRALNLSDDGRRVLTGWDMFAGVVRKDEETLILWEVDTGQIIRNLQGHGSEVQSVDVDWNGGRAVSGALTGTILWDLQTGSALQTFSSGGSIPCAVALLPGGARVLIGTDDGTLTEWDGESGEPVRCFTGHGSGLKAICVAPGGDRAITASRDRTLILWNLKAPADRATRIHTGSVTSVSLTLDGTRALSGAADAKLVLWNVKTAAPEKYLEGHKQGFVMASMSADGHRAVSNSSRENQALVWDLEEAKVIRSLGIRLTPAVGLRKGPPDIMSARMSPDGKLVVTSAVDKNFILWNLETGRYREHLRRADTAVLCLAFSGDQTRFAMTDDNQVVVVRALQGEPAALVGHTDQVFCGALSQDGRIAVTGGKDRKVMVWDVDTKEAWRVFEGHSDNILSVALGADCKRVLSASVDKSLILWDIEKGHAINRMIFESPVLSVAWRGDVVVVGQGGGTVCFLEWR